MCDVQLTQFAEWHREDFLGLDRDPPHRGQHLVAVHGSIGALAVDQHRIATVRVGQRSVRQESRHAELGVARQNAEHRIKFRVETVFLADTRTQLVGDLVTQRVRDDDGGLPVALPDDRLDVIVEESRLRAERD